MWNFNKFLDIPGFHVFNYSSDKTSTYFSLKHRRKTATCPYCQTKTKQIKSLSPVRTIKNGIILGKLCFLQVKFRRFFCNICRKAFTEKLSNLKRRERATLNHKREVVSNLSCQSFSSGTKKYKVSYHTQRKWLDELTADQIFNFDEEKKKDQPFVLGIDEVSFAGRQMVTTIGNITDHHLKGILNSKRKDELKRILRSFSPQIKSLISEVVIDMCPLYLMAVKQVLPNTSIVVDHFHIIQDANKRIDGTRYLLQDIYKKRIPRYILTKNKEDLIGQQIHYLADIIKSYPELNMFYQTKESVSWNDKLCIGIV